MAQNSYYDSDVKHVLKGFGTPSRNPSEKDVNARLVQYCPKAMRSKIAVTAAPEARAKAKWSCGGC